ncbi:kinetochore protein CHL4 like-domain-containing protein [Cokeromyces recurvatus]|uniref:kinetochore protein CHL4 like-domain-containing protein n=1 Tax=Cokeromyces recurvatus TaxID=90255 RepID=UPI002220FB34|nr:kinetochore protein CHL4 like-domain-containing protein [Cokeromyces recurvatus]KAI7899059.1 kinetochore protein CHL4 like-domain-containing protein [Cokeromyces recurvatus]
MLSEKDLTVIEYSNKIDRLLRIHTVRRLTSIVVEWLNTPELQPANKSTTPETYSKLTKLDIIDRIKRIDWPKGLCAIQVAQLDLKGLISEERIKRWKVGKLTKKSGPLKLNLEASTIHNSIEQFLSQFFFCYVYTMHHKKSDLYWMRIHIYSTHERTALTTDAVGYVIYYPMTEFVMWSGRWNMTVASYVMESITDAFRADRILYQNIRGNAVKYLSHLIKIRKSQGVFAQLRNNEVDSNPLDIRQKIAKTDDDDEAYVNKGEQSRRIKPVDEEEVQNRIALVMQNFGWEPMYGTTSVDIDVRLPFSSQQKTMDDEEVRFEINLSGNSVPQGVKQCIKNGQIEMPVVSWLESIGTTGITKLYVTRDGATEIEPEEEEEMNENRVESMETEKDNELNENENSSEEQKSIDEALEEDEVMEEGDDSINDSDDQDSIIHDQSDKESVLSES